ncbi:hypothetical protein ABZ958_26040 [Streptomyces sp. NPDC046237]|uniref:hypothetical protein n=1 Tax=Streptomyces sp. NPDC046237 TaxID=3154914 RepID=UPI00340C1A13
MTTDRSPLPDSTPAAPPEGAPAAETPADAGAPPSEAPAEGRALLGEAPADVRTLPGGAPAPDPDPAVAVRPPATGRRSPAPYVRAVRLAPARPPEPGVRTPPRRRAVSVTPVRLPLPRPEPTAPPTASRPEEPQP